MKLYGVIPFEYSACNWYRTMLPWRTAANLKLADVVVDQYDRVIPHAEERRAHATFYSDINQFHNNYAPGFEMAQKQHAAFPAYWETADKWNFGPSFVIDTDDNMFHIEPLNPAFRDLGTRVHGEVVPKGSGVSLEIPGHGVQEIYKDGEHGFDIERNVRRINQFRKNARAADLLTTTTHRLAKIMATESGAENIHVFPNCIDFNDWPKLDLVQDPSKVRILWQSSSSHFEDMWKIAKQLGDVHRKYPNTIITLFGSPYTWLINQLVEERLEIIPWVPHTNYMLRLSTLNADISIAPLHDSAFNQGRSAIRLYEVSACWKPAATLAEATGPFLDEIIEGETGLLFRTPEDFQTKLEALVENETLRKTLASNAKDWVRTNRDPAVHVPKLIEAYQKLRDNRRMVTVPPAPLADETPDVPLATDQPDLPERENASSGAGL